MAVIELKRNEKYKIETYMGYDSKGKKIRKYEVFYGKKSEAKSYDEEIKRKLKNGIYYDKNMTMNQLIDVWGEQHLPNLAPKTRMEYNRLIPYIREHLGRYKLCKLNPLVLETFYNELRNRPEDKKQLTENTILHYYAIINTMLNKAVKWLFIESNPNQRIDRPKKQKKEASYYDVEQVQYLLEQLKQESLKYQVIIRLAIDSGARRGELTGLEWDDIDFTNHTISINKVTQEVNGNIIKKDSPKNNSSIRVIQITSETIGLLAQYKLEQEKQKLLLGTKWKNCNKILIDDFGGLMHPDTPSKVFCKLTDKYGLPHIKFHSLRHTHASLLIASGVHMKTISKRLGHSSISTTDMISSRVFNSLDSDAVKRLETILN